MSDYLIQSATLEDIADAIRAKTGGSALINPEDMASEIESIQASGGYNLLDELEVLSGYYGTDGSLKSSVNSNHTSFFDVTDCDSVSIYMHRTVKGAIWLALNFWTESNTHISRIETASNLRQATDYIFTALVPTNAKYASASFEHDRQECYVSVFKLPNTDIFDAKRIN